MSSSGICHCTSRMFTEQCPPWHPAPPWARQAETWAVLHTGTGKGRAMPLEQGLGGSRRLCKEGPTQQPLRSLTQHQATRSVLWKEPEAAEEEQGHRAQIREPGPRELRPGEPLSGEKVLGAVASHQHGERARDPGGKAEPRQL